MKKVLPMLASAALLAFAGTASAQGPVALTSAQMDGVTAGAQVFLQASALASAYGETVGNLLSTTTSSTNAVADPRGLINGLPSATATGINTSLGTSVLIPDANGNLLGVAAASSTSSATVSLQ